MQASERSVASFMSKKEKKINLRELTPEESLKYESSEEL